MAETNNDNIIERLNERACLNGHLGGQYGCDFCNTGRFDTSGTNNLNEFLKVNGWEKYDILKHYQLTLKPNKIIEFFLKFEYTNRCGDPETENYEIKLNEHDTIKDVKRELNKSFLFGELDPEQYEIYTGGEQYLKSETMADFYTYSEPVLLDNDDKTLKECNIKSGQLLYLKAKLKIILKIPCCRFTTVYLNTSDALEEIQKRATEILNKRHGDETNPKQITAFYGDTELTEDRELSTYNLYNYTTIKIEVNHC